jgi:alanyl-tRNA synthetase
MTPATERLYYQDSFCLEFNARVVAQGAWEGRPSLVLDRSGFYPESGGQRADRGVLSGNPVLDVQVDETGVVHHLIDGPLPEVGAEVSGSVDRARRRVHMALHTGQHMLSRALADVAGAATVSSRLGESACTIDVDRESLGDRAIAEAEDLTNAVIDDDVPVRAFFPTPEELASLPLRRAPKVTDNVRVVLIGDFDVSPCGGTHCTRSAQVGLIYVSGVERYKGKMRISFAAGPRARRDLVAQSAALRGLGRELSCDVLEVPAGVERLRHETKAAREAAGLLRGRLADAIVTGLLADAVAAGRREVVHLLDDAPMELLRSMAGRITAREGMVAVLAGRMPDGVSVLVARGSGSELDCGAFLKKLAAAAGGRGGGRKEHAEGRLPAGADFEAAVAEGWPAGRAAAPSAIG